MLTGWRSEFPRTGSWSRPGRCSRRSPFPLVPLTPTPGKAVCTPDPLDTECLPAGGVRFRGEGVGLRRHAARHVALRLPRQAQRRRTAARAVGAVHCNERKTQSEKCCIEGAIRRGCTGGTGLMVGGTWIT